MTEYSPESKQNLLLPVAIGGFVGLLGALALGKTVFDDAAQNDHIFLWILLVCVSIGSVLTVVLNTFLRRRSLRKELEAADEAWQIDTERRTGSTSSISTKSKTLKTTSLVIKHDVVFRPLPYRPPMVELTNEEDFEDPFANDKLGDIMEDVFAKLLMRSFEDIVTRVHEEVHKNARGDSEETFQLSAFRSEGPVTEEGRCETGWTLYFVRENESQGCIAIVTRHELSLQYASTKAVELPFTTEGSHSTAPISLAQLPDLAQVVQNVAREVPSLESTALYVRGLSANHVLVYTEDADAIAEVLIEEDAYQLTNGPQFAGRIKDMKASEVDAEQWTFRDILDWYRTQETTNDALDEWMRSTGADIGFRSGDNVVFRRLARGLHASYGAKLTSSLDEVLNTALQEDAIDEAKMLIRCLAFVPTMAAMARLHTFSQKHDERVRAFSADMFKARRRRLHGTESDPIDHLNFPELQRAKGITRVDSIAVRTKTRDFRRDVLERFAQDLNLYVHRIRVVTHRANPSKTILIGDKEVDYSALEHGMITGAWLRTKSGDCDVQINILPVPSFVQYWYVSGVAAWSVLRDIRRMDKQYTTRRLLTTLRNIEARYIVSESPSDTGPHSRQAPVLSNRSDFFEAVLMLQLWDPADRPADAAQYLMRAYTSDFTKNAWQLKSYIIDTLIYIRDTAPNELPPSELEGAYPSIDAFLQEMYNAERTTTHTKEGEILKRVKAALGNPSLVQSGIVRPVISMVKDDLNLEEDSDVQNAAPLREEDEAGTQPVDVESES